MKNKSKTQKGITLIALIITIVVLLILAVVAIRAVQGDGIIQYAKNATTDYQDAQNEEKERLLKMEYQLAEANGTATGGYYDYLLQKYHGVKIGDYVNYTPDTASNYVLTKNESGYNNTTTTNGEQVIQQTTGLKWRVMGINELGQVELISDRPTDTKVAFNNATGYNNGVYILNDICKSNYSNISLGVIGRSLKLEDIEKQLSEEGIKARTDYKNVVSFTKNEYKYGEIITFSVNKKYPILFAEEISSGLENGIEGSNPKYISRDQLIPAFKEDGTTENEATYSEKTTGNLVIKQTLYEFSDTPNNYFNNISFHNMIFNTGSNFWLATRLVEVSNNSQGNFIYFSVGRVWEDFLGGYDLYRSDAGDCSSYCNNFLRPVVTLPLNLKLTGDGENLGTESNMWNITQN